MNVSVSTTQLGQIYHLKKFFFVSDLLFLTY